MTDSLRVRRIIRTVLLYVFALAVAFLVCVPFFWMISTSLKSKGAIMSIPVQWFPKKPSLAAYKKLFAMSNFTQSIFNSFYLAITCTAARILCAAMAAFALTKIRFRGRELTFKI